MTMWSCDLYRTWFVTMLLKYCWIIWRNHSSSLAKRISFSFETCVIPVENSLIFSKLWKESLKTVKVNNSTNINKMDHYLSTKWTITCHLNSLNINKEGQQTWHWKSRSWLGTELNWLKESHSPLLINV